MKFNSTELQPNLAALGLTPEWLRVPSAELYSGIKTSQLYALMAAGEIVFFALKGRPGATRGIRFVNRKSIDTFFARKAAEAGVSLQEMAE